MQPRRGPTALRSLTHRATPSPELVSAFQSTIRAAGLRSTSARLAVLEYFHARGGRNSHAELFDALATRGFDRATIYRVLMDFVDAKILSRADLGDHVWRFELRRGINGAEHLDEHPHFVCVDCGEVSCLPELAFRVPPAAKAPRAVSQRKVAIQLKGKCDNCA